MISTSAAFEDRYKDHLEDSQPIDPKIVPFWMVRARLLQSGALLQPHGPQMAQQMIEDALIEVTRTPISIVATWQTTGGSREDREELRAFMEEHQEIDFLHSTTMKCEADPRVYRQSHFRDALRKLFRCAECGIQISRVRLIIPEPVRVDEDEKDCDFDLQTCDWDLLRAHLKSSFEGSGPGKQVVVKVWMRVLDDGEELYDAPGELLY